MPNPAKYTLKKPGASSIGFAAGPLALGDAVAPSAVGQGPRDAPGLRAGELGLNSAVVIPGGRCVKREPTSNRLSFLGCRRKLFSENVCSETTDQTQKFAFFAINRCWLFCAAVCESGG